MATVTAKASTERSVAPTVYSCYDVLDLAPLCGIIDFTDGKYVDDRNDRAAYLAAQERQAEYLLDQVECGAGTRLLDIGCGYGRILEQTARRGARPVGITISPHQVAQCRARGLEAYQVNYRHIFSVAWSPPTNDDAGSLVGNAHPTKAGAHPWEHAFDALVANGSLEHFVQVADAAAGRTDDIYEELFAICRRLVQAAGRFVTTAIHFREHGQFDPHEILKGHRAHPRGSPNYHVTMLEETMGGWYPEPGQLQRCAAPYFELIAEEDGTSDYHLTSEYWLKRFKSRLATSPRLWWNLAQKWWRSPAALGEMLRCQVWDQSWFWQFRPPAPMRLLRQTWAAR